MRLQAEYALLVATIALSMTALILVGCGEFPQDRRNREVFSEPGFNEERDCDSYARDPRSARFNKDCPR